MEILVVFDNDFNCAHLLEKFSDKEVTIHLFPLTSNFLVIEKIHQAFKTLQNAQVNLIESAKNINNEVLKMQRVIARWSSELANLSIGKKNLKEWFILPDKSSTSWWYGILSEKNAVQETVIFQIAQVNAIKAQLQKQQYYKCYVASADRKIQKITTNIAKNLNVKIKILPVAILKTRIKAQVFNSISQWGFFGAILAAAINWLVWIKNSIYVKRILPNLRKRIKAKNPLLFISYFPNIDNEAAKQGIFKNKYALALQEKLGELDTPITWLLMPVFYNGHNFKSACKLARKFIGNGQQIFVLQEFFNFKVFTKAFLWWLRQASLGLYLYARVDKKKLTGDMAIPEALPIIKYLWMNSFVGASSVRGLVFYLTYREVFKKITGVDNCLYYCEMQAWEKAAITAKKQVAPHVKTLAFQHTVIGRNYYNYFYDSKDTNQQNKITDFPTPDMLIANGKRMHELLAESKFPGLCEAEAIRQLYLSKAINAPEHKTVRPVLFIGGSCDKTEMKSLLSMLYTAYPAPLHFEVWIKASPVNPVEPIFEALKIDAKHAGYKIFHTDVSELLKSASVALIANTTVSIEAAANGCPVIVPIFADTMLMNPILETAANYYEVSTVEELKAAVDELLFSAHEQQNQAFIHNYWNINPDIPLWTNLLSRTVLCNTHK